MASRIVAHQELAQRLRSVLEAAGTPTDLAVIVAESLVAANLAGHDSHGVIRVLQYLEEVRAGALDPAARAEVVRQSGAVSVVDGKWGWGQPAMMLATVMASDAAARFGIAIATVERCYHVGRLAPYVEMLAERGHVGLATANAGPAVAPYGSRGRVLGTNPFAWAAPREPGEAPIALDIATAFVAEGKLRVARSKGLPAPRGSIVNVEGAPSIDPNDFYDGGALMPFGGHKGSGIGILAQVLGAGLAGMTPERLHGHRGANGSVVIAIDPGHFGLGDAFSERVEGVVDAVHQAPPAAGFDEVLIPGEPEVREARARRETGIEIPKRVWIDLCAEAARWGVDLES